MLNLDYTLSPEDVSDNKDEAVERFYLQQAYCTINTWFSEDQDDLFSFIAFFRNRSSEKQSVRVIWYDTQEKENAENIALFNRLNDGKIPLTNAELIKALFFNNQNDEKQIIMADRWAAIENSLEDNEFWYFVYSENKSCKHYSTRIEYLFDLYLEKKYDPNKDYDRYETFYAFRDKFFGKTNEEKSATWEQIVGIFEKLREWYGNRECFHRIGFLIQTGMSMLDILKIKKNKRDFTQKIKEFIKKSFPEDKNLEDYSYDKCGDHRDIRNILLLFNIESILQNPKSCIRFSFANYAISWDIEHIRSIASEPPPLNKAQKWYRNILPYFVDCEFTLETFENKIDDIQQEIDSFEAPETKKLVQRILNCAKGEKLRENSDNLFSDIVKYCKEDNLKTRHDLGNLALLDSYTNRSYKNAPFPIKRKRITDNTKNGIFTPLCTLNVFLKFYSKKSTDSLVWGDEDANQYRAAMADLLKEYFSNSEDVSNDEKSGD